MSLKFAIWKVQRNLDSSKFPWQKPNWDLLGLHFSHKQNEKKFHFMPETIPTRHWSFEVYGRHHRPELRSNPFRTDTRKHPTCHGFFRRQLLLLGSRNCHSRQSKRPFIMIWSGNRFASNVCRNAHPCLSRAEIPRKSRLSPGGGENPWPSYSLDLNPFVFFSEGRKWRWFFVRSRAPSKICWGAELRSRGAVRRGFSRRHGKFLVPLSGLLWG